MRTNHDLNVVTVICLMVIAVALVFIAVVQYLDRLENRDAIDEVLEAQHDNTAHLLLYLQQIHGYTMPAPQPGVWPGQRHVLSDWGPAKHRDPDQLELPFNVVDARFAYSD